MKKMTPTQATERLAAMIEPKPERDGRAGEFSEGEAWLYAYMMRESDMSATLGWIPMPSFFPLHDIGDAIRAVEAAGYRAAIGYVEHTQNTGEACVAMRSNVHYRTYHEYTDGNHALALCLALLHALEGEPVDIVDEGEVTT